MANVRTDAAMWPDAPMHLDSQTKTWVAALILQLVAEGRLRLDETVERWLPGVAVGRQGPAVSKVSASPERLGAEGHRRLQTWGGWSVPSCIFWGLGLLPERALRGTLTAQRVFGTSGDPAVHRRAVIGVA